MGIRLMVEILDHWQDAGLTAGERSDLLVIAENAKDSTRETFGPIHEDYILKRVGKKAAVWRVAIASLKKKGVLEYAVRDGREMSGRPGQFAVYRLAVLCPEAPHDGLRGQCTRPERVSSQLTHSAPGNEAMGYPTANALDGMGYPTATQRVSPQLTPSPLVSSVTTSSLAADSPASPDPQSSPAASSDERETFSNDAQKIAAAWTAARGSRNSRAEARVAASATELLADGWSIPDLVALAEHMARASPQYTDLAKHEGHWQASRCGTRPPVAAYKAPTF